MRRLAIAFSGPSNSGKTTLILKVGKKFIKDGLKVAIVKHDPGDKAKFDVEGKDSFKFSQIGADVVVASPTRTTYSSAKRMREAPAGREEAVMALERLKRRSSGFRLFCAFVSLVLERIVEWTGMER